ncbi:MAG: class I SAM-dependent methyltransferase [Deltaproteobacteria bacterium]|nr:class I SAM-dependent methyltransferase [Deltaproteobacteria bacterium]
MNHDDKARFGEYEARGDYHRKIDRNWHYYPVYVEKMAFVRRYLDRVGTSARIIDLGCGEGLLVEEYRAKGFDIRGVDAHYSSDCVERGSITKLSHADRSYDCVMALDVIEHLQFEQQEAAIGEIYRILRPGGRALISVPNLAHLASRVAFFALGRLIRTSEANRHPGDRPIAEYLKLTRAAGLRLVSRKGIFPTLPVTSAVTALSPRHALPLHKLVNRLFALPDICFLNMLEFERPAG